MVAIWLRLRTIIRSFGLTDYVLLTGPLYDEAKLEAYVDADVFAYPSFYEVFGLSPLEACACGTPTIVTNRCGVAEWIESVACVIDYDADQLQSAMCYILQSAHLRGEMGKKKFEDGCGAVQHGQSRWRSRKIYRACLKELT